MNDTPSRAGRLSAGPVRSWVRGKPRLATSAPQLTGQKQPSTFGYLLGVLFRSAVLLAGLFVLVAAAAWFLLASTVMATPKIGDDVWVVQRAAWVEGKAPAGALVVANGQPVRVEILERMSETVTGYPDGFVAELVAPANAEIAVSEDGFLIVDGDQTTILAPDLTDARELGQNYFASCVTGACGEPGTLFEIPVSHVLGQALYRVDFAGGWPSLEAAG